MDARDDLRDEIIDLERTLAELRRRWRDMPMIEREVDDE